MIRASISRSQRAVGNPASIISAFRSRTQELDEIYGRLRDGRGRDRRARRNRCCYAESEKSWIEDPAGIAWETFLHQWRESPTMATAPANARRAWRSESAELSEPVAAEPLRAQSRRLLLTHAGLRPAPPSRGRSARAPRCWSPTVVGSGIMAERLTEDVALALLGNTLATGAILVVLITIFGPISGAHFNPAVTLVFALRARASAGEAALPMSRRRLSAASPARWPRIHVCAAAARGRRERCGPAERNGLPNQSRLSAWSHHPRRLALRAATRCHGWSGSTSPPPTGSPPRPPSPIPPWRSRASSRTRFPASGRSICPAFIARRTCRRARSRWR